MNVPDQEKAKFCRFRPRRGLSIYSRGNPDDRWRQFVPLFDSAWDMEAPVKCKRSRKVVVRHELDGRAYYVKIYSRRHAEGLEHNLLRSSSLALFTNKAIKHIKLAAALQNVGVDVVEPIMAIERRYGLFRQESMLVTPEYTRPSLSRCFQDADDWQDYLPALGNMIRDIATMHRNGFIQRDPHFGNVLVKDDLNIIWLDFGTIKRFRFNKKKTYRDLRTLWKKTVTMLEGRARNPETSATELLEKNYPDIGRLRKAIAD